VHRGPPSLKRRKNALRRSKLQAWNPNATLDVLSARKQPGAIRNFLTGFAPNQPCPQRSFEFCKKFAEHPRRHLSRSVEPCSQQLSYLCALVCNFAHLLVILMDPIS